jgi:hypothetical protein
MEQGARNERKSDNAYTSGLAITEFTRGRSDCVEATTCDRYNRKPALIIAIALRHQAHRTHARLSRWHSS